jgi:hypothetical protein
LGDALKEVPLGGALRLLRTTGYFSKFFASDLFLDDGQILANGVTDIIKGLLFSSPLRPATRESRHGNAVALF